MRGGVSVLAVVPARAGSKGVKNKNMRTVGGLSLIARAGHCLAQLPWLDARIISTDSQVYADEGQRYGLEAPFLRPAELSNDTASAVATITHALQQAEICYHQEFEVVLIVEPTSPLRRPGDLTQSTDLLLSSQADSVVTVSPVDSKYHPRKVFTLTNQRLTFFDPTGAQVVTRQSLDRLYYRNGICYALRRACLLEKQKIITENTLPLIIERPVVNIDTPLELLWAEFLLLHEQDDQNQESNG